MWISEVFSIDDLVDDPDLDRGEDTVNLTVEIQPGSVRILGDVMACKDEPGELPDNWPWYIGRGLELLRAGSPARAWAEQWSAIADALASKGEWS